MAKANAKRITPRRGFLVHVKLERLRELLHYDQHTGLFTWLRRTSWRAPEGAVAGTINAHGRCVIMVDQRLYQAHRLAWVYMTGEWPPDEIDHINCDPTDNRFSEFETCYVIAEQAQHAALFAELDGQEGRVLP